MDPLGLAHFATLAYSYIFHVSRLIVCLALDALLTT
jgi:hypothetical protein